VLFERALSIERCECPIAGYLIVSPRVRVSSLSQLSSEHKRRSDQLSTARVDRSCRSPSVLLPSLPRRHLRFIFIYFRDGLATFSVCALHRRWPGSAAALDWAPRRSISRQRGLSQTRKHLLAIDLTSNNRSSQPLRCMTDLIL